MSLKEKRDWFIGFIEEAHCCGVRDTDGDDALDLFEKLFNYAEACNAYFDRVVIHETEQGLRVKVAREELEKE